MKKSKGWTKKAIPLLFLALGLVFFVTRNALKKTKVDFYVLKPININYTVLASCTVDYPKPLDMTFLEEGIVKVVEVRDGDHVRKGQGLIQLDDFEAKRNLTMATDSLKASRLKLKNAREEILPNLQEKLKEYEVNLAQAEQMLQRYRNIEAAGGISKAELEKAEKEYQVALSQYNQQKLEVESFSKSGQLADLEAQVSIAQAQYELATRRLENTRITAPFDGLVLKVHVQVGQKVNPNTKAITILENASWQLVLNVDQRELPFLRAGLPAQVMLDAYPDRKIKGRVAYVCTEVDKERNTCELRVEIGDDIPIVKYGMAGKAEILAAEFKDVLALPSRFVKKKAGKNYVWLWDGNRAQLLDVKVKELGERWALVENIPAQAVILNADLDMSPAKLKPGQEVHPSW